MRWMLFLFLWLVTASVTKPAWAGETVMLIHSYHKELKWVQDITTGVKQELGDNYQLSVHYMDTKRLPKGLFKYSAVRAFKAYKELNPSLVIICDDNGFRLLGERISDTTPVVFCGINSDIRLDYPWAINTRQVTGVVERPMIKRSIVEFAKVAQIEPRKALILLGNSVTAKAFYQHDLGSQSHFKLAKYMQVDVVQMPDIESWKDKIRASKKQGYDLILIAGYGAMHERNGRYVGLDELSQWVAANSPVMTMTVHEQAIGMDKVMAGMVVSGILMGQDAASLAKEMLTRSEDDSHPIPIHFQSQGKVLVSQKEMDDWGIKIEPSRTKSLIILP